MRRNPYERVRKEIGRAAFLAVQAAIPAQRAAAGTTMRAGANDPVTGEWVGFWLLGTGALEESAVLG